MEEQEHLGEKIANLRRLLEETRRRNIELAERNRHLERHNAELREALDALLRPAPSEVLEKNLQHPARRLPEKSGA